MVEEVKGSNLPLENISNMIEPEGATSAMMKFTL